MGANQPIASQSNLGPGAAVQQNQLPTFVGADSDTKKCETQREILKMQSILRNHAIDEGKVADFRDVSQNLYEKTQKKKKTKKPY